MTASTLERSALHPADLLRVGSIGLLTRRTRAALSALGIAIGIAAMVAVLGISDSSKADLLASLDRLGTNLLTVQAGAGIGGGPDTTLPATASQMLGRIQPVEQVSSATPVDGGVFRSDLVPSTHTAGITIKAVDPALLTTLGARLADGVWLDSTRSTLPVVVLGSIAADRLGITAVGDGVRVWLDGHWFSVTGILAPVELAQDIDRSVLIGRDVAITTLGADDTAGTVYLRTAPDSIDAVRDVVAATANPAHPDQVTVSRPSDAIAAKADASSAFTDLFLALGAVALLVGGVGIANVMVISVLERRSEIGLRRSLGATRRHVSLQFLAEALVLSALGGLGGALLGAAVTAVYDLIRGWTVLIPYAGMVGGFAAAVIIGAVAGLYPAARAARLSPTEALRTV
jgi:putative ABC transport system permease protein